MDDRDLYLPTYRFQPKQTDDLRPDCLPYIGKIVHVRSWHENIAMGG